MASARLTFTGKVIGDVSAQPQALAMGIAAQGAGRTGQIVLSEKTVDVLRSLRITSDSAWLTVLPAAPATAPSPTQALVVKLTPGVPAGSFQTQLNIMLASGQRLIIPVTAYITPARD